jgi:hypothetical protein
MRVASILLLIFSVTAQAQFDGPGGEPGSKSIHKDDQAIIGWASEVTLERGWMQVSDTSFGRARTGKDSSTLGAFDGDVVSLGDGGRATLSFNSEIVNRPGYDFAVFENGFKVGISYYLELAHVEVSYNGVDFVRFPSESLTDTSYQTNNFSYTKPENIYNLAGKHQAPYGTLFDLEEVGLDTVKFIRIVDVVGSVNDSFGSRDNKGRIINDPFPSPFESSGFDLDAVALVNGSFLSVNTESLSNLKVYPTRVEANGLIHVTGVHSPILEVMNSTGQIIKQVKGNSIKVSQNGLYFLTIKADQSVKTIKVCVY